MSASESRQVTRATELIEPIADDFGCEIVDIDYNNGVLKVVIDEPGGLNSQTLVDVTKAVSRMVDAEDPIPGRFTLEITSPGVERPLKKPQHFQRSVGETILIKTLPDVEIAGARRAEGELTNADEYGITLTIDGGKHVIKYGEIRSARTVFAWGPTPKKGGKANQNKNKPKNSTPKDSTSKDRSSATGASAAETQATKQPQESGNTNTPDQHSESSRKASLHE